MAVPATAAAQKVVSILEILALPVDKFSEQGKGEGNREGGAL